MNNYVEVFISTMMKNFPFGEYGDIVTIKAAAGKAYIDFQPRTVKGHGQFENPKEKAVEWLSSFLDFDFVDLSTCIFRELCTN